MAARFKAEAEQKFDGILDEIEGAAAEVIFRWHEKGSRRVFLLKLR